MQNSDVKIPAPLSADYRIATSRDIRSWSFGALTSTQDASATVRDNVRGTLLDQRIFGPIHDFKCACGKYAGGHYKGMICDWCGVKIAPSAVRSSRFGHIDFSDPLRHPFAADSELQCFPVLPILFVESPGGSRLSALYDELVAASKEQTVGETQRIVTSIVDHLTPVVVTAHNWRLAASRILARGVALEYKHVADDSDQYCAQCGYLLAGLQVIRCPGCGTQLE